MRTATMSMIKKQGVPIRKDEFQGGVSFDSIIDLYLFDKRLRQMMLDALERIENLHSYRNRP